MNPQTLLAELDPLTHRARVQRMVALGEEVARNTETAALLDALESGDFAARFLCLQSCYGSHNGARVLRMLSDPSQLLRDLARRLVPLCADDAQARAALRALRGRLQADLAIALAQKKRQAVIDAFLTSDGDPAGELLPFASAATVAEHRSEMLESAGRAGWVRLARYQPDQAAQELIALANAATQFDPRLLWQANLVLPIITRLLPDAALAVVRALLPHVSLSQISLGILPLRYPQEIAALLLEGSDTAPINLSTRARALLPETLVALLERRPHTLGGRAASPRWLAQLPPAQRGALWERFGAAWISAEGGVLDTSIVALLPAAPRVAEGRRHLASPFLSTRPQARVAYAAFLPWEEALAVVQPLLQNPNADLRGAALAALTECVRFNSAHLPDLLARFHARRNEQDPIRQVMMTGLANLPPSRFRAEHLPALAEVIADALSAADLSGGTSGAVQRLLVGLLPAHPAWAAGQISVVAKTVGHFQFSGLESRISDADARRFVPEVLLVLKAWESRERTTHLISFALALGKRLRAAPELATVLERLLENTKDSYTPGVALGMLKKHFSERFAHRVPALLKADKSWVTFPIVASHLHLKRQDLLDPFLGRIAYAGRFSTGKTRFVLPFSDGFHRWNPAQRATFALTLGEITRDTARDNYGIYGAIKALAALPDVAPTRIIELAQLSNDKLALRDTALRALARHDAGQGVQTLLDAMGDDRARIAVYALRHALMAMPPDRALALLQTLPLARVTVAKEVVRLLGDLRTEPAYRYLLSLDRPDLHRDIRVAVLRGLWGHLERAETWPVLERAAADPDPAVAVSIAQIPAEMMSTASRERYLSALATLLRHADATVRLAVLTRLATLPIADRARTLLPAVQTALGAAASDETQAAASALMTTYRQETGAIEQALAAILPSRRALQTALVTLAALARADRRLYDGAARAALRALEPDPLTGAWQARLAAELLPLPEAGDFLQRTARAGRLHADKVGTVAALLPTRGAAEGYELAALETRLAGDSDGNVRRLGLAALVGTAQARGWTPELRARLEIYRGDESVVVAEAAQFTFPPRFISAEK